MNELVKLNDQLLNAPAGVIIILFAIALGYILKAASFFPNNRIPLAIVLFTAVMFPIIQFCADKIAETKNAGYKIPLNVLIGFILGFVSWLFHAQILRRFIDPKLLKTGFDTQPPIISPDNEQNKKTNEQK